MDDELLIAQIKEHRFKLLTFKLRKNQLLASLKAVNQLIDEQEDKIYSLATLPPKVDDNRVID